MTNKVKCACCDTENLFGIVKVPELEKEIVYCMECSEIRAIYDYDCILNFGDLLEQVKTTTMSETKKLRVFTDTFNELSGLGKENVVHSDFVAALIKNGFELEEAHDMIRKAQQNGQIYERQHGVYAKA